MSPTNTPLLGAYLIVKDAEDTIETLLRSLVFKNKDGYQQLSVDELVIVDTGSTDRTRDLIEAFTAAKFDPDETSSATWAVKRLSPPDSRFFERIVLARMAWPDDFSIARNYAFSLGTAKWRMWLDADDIFPRSENLVPTIQALEIRDASINTIVIPYDYCPPDVMQDKMRIVRWADGWRWEGVIHEEIVRYPKGSRTISYVKDLVVQHRPKDPQHGEKSLARNTALCLRTQEKAIAAGDARTAGIMAYYLGMYARNLGRISEARVDLEFAADALVGSNLACYSLVELTRGELKAGDTLAALNAASRAIAMAPELPDGWGALGVVLTELKHYGRAALVFDRLKQLPKAPLEATRDRVWNDGIVWATAGVAYVHMNQSESAVDALKRVPATIVLNEQVWMIHSRAVADVQKLLGLRALEHYTNYLIANNEPVKAVEVLDRLAPSNVEALPAVSSMRTAITDKMQQLLSWRDYCRVYAAECNEVFDRDAEGVNVIRAQGRAQQALRWARMLPKEGPPVNLYVIGLHGGWIEEDVLDANSRIVMTACDVNPNANEAIKRLTAKFPDRVFSHAVRTHHYDWIPEGKEGFFDALFCFEVIEHVPDDHQMVHVLNRLLKKGGQLLLSTPIAEYWVAPEAHQRHHWHQHVRAYQPDQLWRLLSDYGFGGDLYATDNRILHFAHMVKKSETTSVDLSRRITSCAIWCPGTPEPFDALSPSKGHCGGSEEAVIHLSHALAKTGALDVTVYTNLPDRDFKPHVSQSVLWRPLEEFDPSRLEGSVLVWRNPKSAVWLKGQNPKLRVLNWLHDVSYGCSVADYQAADGVVTLSWFHQKAIEKNDGYSGPFLDGMNGILPEEFDGIDGQIRDAHKVIYASAPNRGLDLLLEIWPAIRAAVPDATLDIFYGWEITEKMMRRDSNLRMQLEPLLARLRRAIDELKTQGVVYHGGVSHEALHRAYARSGVWAAPERDFEETYCISALKAQASGCIPVVWRSGALPEICNTPYIADSLEQFRDMLISALEADHGSDRDDERQWALEQTWDRAASRFQEFLTEVSPEVAIFATFGRQFDDVSLYESGASQLGGSEEAVILLSDALARRGCRVTVYADLPGRAAHRSTAGVYWMPWESLRPSTGLNIVWRDAGIASQLRTRWPEAAIILWLMDPTCDHLDVAGDTVDHVVVLSEEHRRLLRIAPSSTGLEIIPNGLDLTELPPLSIQNDKGRHPEWVMWATSHDRGLLEFLETWPEVRAAVPDAQLHIFYGRQAWMDRAHANGDTIALGKLNRIDNLIVALASHGVVDHGAVSRTELLAWHTRCGTWAYPVRHFEETFCISALKAAACGMSVVTWDEGAIPEVLNVSSLDSPSRYVPRTGDAGAAFTRTLIDAIRNPASVASRLYTAQILRKRYDINTVAQKWIQLSRSPFTSIGQVEHLVSPEQVPPPEALALSFPGTAFSPTEN